MRSIGAFDYRRWPSTLGVVNGLDRSEFWRDCIDSAMHIRRIDLYVPSSTDRATGSCISRIEMGVGKRRDKREFRISGIGVASPTGARSSARAKARGSLVSFLNGAVLRAVVTIGSVG